MAEADISQPYRIPQPSHVPLSQGPLDISILIRECRHMFLGIIVGLRAQDDTQERP
ncbi:hypothetical protein Krac_11933 [Ktedonobacter racemifer DSM 44963]|uniref:Uncharacterized protein n=1 Tax=Ktedonobacter racemifer DSM 44963 TaxID=485913 RepID=D6TEE2_KTERA|nr:hypothetical protein Krac_11933 [Ktedonobacter racemifer DSM 44963]